MKHNLIIFYSAHMSIVVQAQGVKIMAEAIHTPTAPNILGRQTSEVLLAVERATLSYPCISITEYLPDDTVLYWDVINTEMILPVQSTISRWQTTPFFMQLVNCA